MKEYLDQPEHKPWLETIGLMDSLVTCAQPSKSVSWINRYGQSRKGFQYHFRLIPNDEQAHDRFIIVDAEVGVQSNNYNPTTNQWNTIDYKPAYGFARYKGNLLLTKTYVTKDGILSIPTVLEQFRSLTPEDVISDIHAFMLQQDD